MAEVFARRGDSVLVLHGEDGLDEFTTTAPTKVWAVADGAVRALTLDAARPRPAPVEARGPARRRRHRQRATSPGGSSPARPGRCATPCWSTRRRRWSPTTVAGAERHRPARWARGAWSRRRRRSTPARPRDAGALGRNGSVPARPCRRRLLRRTPRRPAEISAGRTERSRTARLFGWPGSSAPRRRESVRRRSWRRRGAERRLSGGAAR